MEALDIACLGGYHFRVTQISALEISRLQAMSQHEKRLKSEGFCRVAGVDEAGRGPLAGPVVAASCIFLDDVFLPHLNDSKQLTSEQRASLFVSITTCPNLIYSIGIVDVSTIDRINILQATFFAMQKAVASLSVQPDYILVDGNRLPHFQAPAEAIIEGDGASVSIAAASIIAKVTRDRLMCEFDTEYPEYNFKQNKGYGTEEHLEALRRYGPSPIHRKSFDPVKSMLSAVQMDLYPFHLKLQVDKKSRKI